MLVGRRKAVAMLLAQLDREANHGYTAIGCFLPINERALAADAFNGLTVLGTPEEVAD